jgi:hypothetical protein
MELYSFSIRLTLFGLSLNSCKDYFTFLVVLLVCIFRSSDNIRGGEEDIFLVS